MRPLIVAEPILRAGRPETVAASNFSGCCARTEEARKMINREIRTARVQRAEAVIYDPHWTVNLFMRDRLRAGQSDVACSIPGRLPFSGCFFQPGRQSKIRRRQRYIRLDRLVLHVLP